MLIIGCDFHSGFQQIAIFDNHFKKHQQENISERTLEMTRIKNRSKTTQDKTKPTEFACRMSGRRLR
jgi:hypothetical protein